MQNQDHKEILDIVIKHLTLEQRIAIQQELRNLALQKIDNLYTSLLRTEEKKTFFKENPEKTIS